VGTQEQNDRMAHARAVRKQKMAERKLEKDAEKAELDRMYGTVKVPRRRRKISDLRAEQAEAKRERIITLLSEGHSVKDVQADVEMSPSMWLYHRKKYPAWAARCDYIRSLQTRQGLAKIRSQDHLPFADFVRTFFTDRRPHLEHNLWMADELARMGPRDVKMFLIWPEAGKTATLEDYICKVLAEDPSHRFRYVSEASDLSKRVIGTVKRRMTDDQTWPHYIKRFGPFYEAGQEKNGRPWTSEQLMVAKNESGERDRNLVASSWTSAVYGSRIDTLILDDLQSQRNYVQAEEIFRRIRGTFFNRGLEMRTLIIGTRIGPGDFYERMEDAGLITSKIILPAAGGGYKRGELVGGEHYQALPDEPTVPAFWDRHNMVHNNGPCCHGFRICPNNLVRLTPREFMEVIKHQSGAETWWASYMQNPQANERTTFAEFVEQCLDHDRRFGKLSA
jgi:hypothetical protein